MSRVAELDDSSLERLKLMIGLSMNRLVLTIVNCLADGTSAGGDGIIRCYVGFEPSGKAHIGWKVISLQMKRMLDSGANVLIFLADWHAWVNDKFSGVMEDIGQLQHTWRRHLEHYLAIHRKEKVPVSCDSCGHPA